MDLHRRNQKNDLQSQFYNHWFTNMEKKIIFRDYT